MEFANTIINLQSLFDLSEKLNTASEERFIFNSVLLSLMGKLTITKAAVFLPQDRMLKPYLIKGQCDILWAELFEINQLIELNLDEKLHRNFIKCGYKYAIPIKDSDELFCIIFLGQKISKAELSDVEFQYARLVSIIASISINNIKNYTNLRLEKTKAEQKSQLLETIFSISNDFNTILSKDKIINLLTYSLMGQLMVNRFAVVLNDSNQNPKIIANRFGKEPTVSMLKDLNKLKESITLEKLINNKLVSNEQEEFLKSINAGVLSPMQVSGESKGWLVLGEKLNGEKFTDDNLQFIVAISNTAVTALENARLVQEEIKKKQLESEMNLALDIQKNLLPKSSPTIKNYDIFGKSIPSRSVGGDYFDHIKIDNNRYLLLIADVSGKGLPAAMIMANLQSSLKLLAPMDLDLSKIVNSVSKLLFQNTSSDKFVTMFLGILNVSENTLTYTNAGHNPPYLVRDGEISKTLSEGGLILGLLDTDFEYQVEKINLEKGDLIFAFTDGITENKNSRNEEFGESGLEKFLEENFQKSSENLLNQLIDQLKIFSYGASQYDDITAISIKLV
jgi:sigma-B regulation protein RsbU (phosphoserine phosphatase)